MRLIDEQTAYNVLTDYYHHTTDTQHEALKEALGRVETVEAVPVVRKPVEGYEGYYEVDQFGHIEAFGERHTRKEWGNLYGIDPDTIRCRMNRGWTAEKAISTPLMKNQYAFERKDGDNG